MDLIRYYLISNGPETKDTDFTWKSFVNANNNELVGLFGNLINRTLAFVNKNFDGEIPQGKVDKKFTDEMFKLYCDVGDNIEEGNFKKALEYIFSLIKKSFEIILRYIFLFKKFCQNRIFLAPVLVYFYL